MKIGNTGSQPFLVVLLFGSISCSHTYRIHLENYLMFRFGGTDNASTLIDDRRDKITCSGFSVVSFAPARFEFWKLTLSIRTKSLRISPNKLYALKLAHERFAL